MNIFISGGAKNGKSYYAQKRAKELAEETGLPLYYIATMVPSDDEDRERIKRHLRERDGWGFITIEKPMGLCEIFDEDYLARTDGNSICESGNSKVVGADKSGVFLVDSVTAILANSMFDANDDYAFNENAAKDVAGDLTRFALTAKNAVFVSDFIYNDPASSMHHNLYNTAHAALASSSHVSMHNMQYTNYADHHLSYLEPAAGSRDYTEEYRRGLAYVDRSLAKICDEVIEISAGIPTFHKSSK